MPGIGVFHKPPLEIETAKTASFTAAAGYIYPVNLGSVTADLTLTFPSSPATDDRFAVYVSSTHSSGGTSTNFADRPYFCVEPANATSINGSSYSADAGEGSGIYGLWLDGEYMEYFYDGSTWRIAIDGRIMHDTRPTKDTNTSLSNNTLTYIPFETESKDNASLHSTSTNTSRVTIKRAGEYCIGSNYGFTDNSTGERLGRFRLNRSSQICIERKNAFEESETTITDKVTLSARDFVELQLRQDSSIELNALASITKMSVTETR